MTELAFGVVADRDARIVGQTLRAYRRRDPAIAVRADVDDPDAVMPNCIEAAAYVVVVDASEERVLDAALPVGIELGGGRGGKVDLFEAILDRVAENRVEQHVIPAAKTL